MKTVPISRFGKDHWSLLAYVETCCVDSVGNTGRLDPLRMRCNPKRHPMMAVARFGERRWEPTYGTRLRMTRTGKVSQLKTHDDWDCLDDLEAAGLVEVLSLINGFVHMTEDGLKVAHALREHKAKGGVFATFRWPVQHIGQSAGGA